MMQLLIINAFFLNVEFYQEGRTNIRKKLLEDTLTNASINIWYCFEHHKGLS